MQNCDGHRCNENDRSDPTRPEPADEQRFSFSLALYCSEPDHCSWRNDCRKQIPDEMSDISRYRNQDSRHRQNSGRQVEQADWRRDRFERLLEPSYFPAYVIQNTPLCLGQLNHSQQ